MNDCIVLCSNDCCKHNSGCGYYGVCNHPDRAALIPTNVDRVYQDKCYLMEVRKDNAD